LRTIRQFALGKIRFQIYFRVFKSHFPSLLPSIPSFCQRMLDGSLRTTNLEYQGQCRWPRFARGNNTALSRSDASRSPYPAFIRARSCFSVAKRFLSLTQTHHRECKSSQDLFRSS
jgi:hypothetical protein